MTGYALTETPLGQPLGRESAGLEPKDERRRMTLGSGNAGRRIVLAIAVAIAVLAGAVAMSDLALRGRAETTHARPRTRTRSRFR